MRAMLSSVLLVSLLASVGCLNYDEPTPETPAAPKQEPTTKPAETPGPGQLPYAREAHPKEKHFTNIRQLTDGGENAETRN